MALVGALALAVLGGCAPDFPDALYPDQALPDEPPPWITAAEAGLFVGREGVSFVDARPGRSTVPGSPAGAVQIDWTEFGEGALGGRSGKLNTDPTVLAEVVGGKGIARDDWVILFGDPLELWGEEGRIAWVLTALGQRAVSVVDGGVPAWEQAGLPMQRGRLERPAKPYQPRWDSEVLANRDEVERWVDAGREWNRVILDVREPGEFRGAIDAPRHGAIRRGHIPGAVNVPWRSLLDDQGLLLPRDRLGEILLAQGVRPDAHVIVYCTGGVRSGHTWWVLRSLGFPSVRNYAGSWWEWSLDRRLPIERGGRRELPPAPPWPPVVDSPAQDAQQPLPDQPAPDRGGDTPPGVEP